MAKRVFWTVQAKADVRRLEQSGAWQILKTFGRYVLTGEGATKQLKGVSPPLLRPRAQNHRVFFRDERPELQQRYVTTGSHLTECRHTRLATCNCFDESRAAGKDALYLPPVVTPPRSGLIRDGRRV